MSTQTNFERWAELLITRKVPGHFGHLINSEVIHSGADILKHGGAFEVHLEQASRTGQDAHWESSQGRIFVTPIQPRTVRVHTN